MRGGTRPAARTSGPRPINFRVLTGRCPVRLDPLATKRVRFGTQRALPELGPSRPPDGWTCLGSVSILAFRLLGSPEIGNNGGRPTAARDGCSAQRSPVRIASASGQATFGTDDGDSNPNFASRAVAALSLRHCAGRDGAVAHCAVAVVAGPGKSGAAHDVLPGRHDQRLLTAALDPVCCRRC